VTLRRGHLGVNVDVLKEQLAFIDYY